MSTFPPFTPQPTSPALPDGPPVPFEQLKARGDELVKLVAARFTAGDHAALEARLRELDLVIDWAQNPDPSGSHGGFDQVSWTNGSKIVQGLREYLRMRDYVQRMLSAAAVWGLGGGGGQVPVPPNGAPPPKGVPVAPDVRQEYRINGSRVPITSTYVNYEYIVDYLSPHSAGRRLLYTVTYKGGRDGEEGTLLPRGSHVQVVPGMSFNAVVTGNG